MSASCPIVVSSARPSIWSALEHVAQGLVDAAFSLAKRLAGSFSPHPGRPCTRKLTFTSSTDKSLVAQVQAEIVTDAYLVDRTRGKSAPVRALGIYRPRRAYRPARQAPKSIMLVVAGLGRQSNTTVSASHRRRRRRQSGGSSLVDRTSAGIVQGPFEPGSLINAFCA